MSEGTSPRKPADEDIVGERASDQVIRLDSQREQRRGNNPPVVEDDELEAPVAPEPATLEA
ncbi:HlyD family secretion protein, partial [Mesorhizobium sp. M1C.F.Ca.ET.193.01.1.1]